MFYLHPVLLIVNYINQNIGDVYMIINQKIQKTIEEIYWITSVEMSVFTSRGKIVASTENADKNIIDKIFRFIQVMDDDTIDDNTRLFKIEVDGDVEYILSFENVSKEGAMLGKMAACQIKNLVINTSDKFDRNNFIQNILLGNLLAVDILGKAKKLHIDNKLRIAYVIDTGEKENDIVLELVKNLSDTRTGDFVVTLDAHSVVLIKDISDISEEDQEEELEAIAKRLVDNLLMEAMIKVRVGYGNPVVQIGDIASSFREAKMAIQVGRVFYAEKETISYGRLGIGRLIYQLPMSLCEMFIKEVFGEEIPDILDDEEAMSTINKFFENNLNISETARQLYVHRNTLVYRLERIEKAIGLDIRTFDDAMTFRIAVMVIAHLKDMKNEN